MKKIQNKKIYEKTSGFQFHTWKSPLHPNMEKVEQTYKSTNFGPIRQGRTKGKLMTPRLESQMDEHSESQLTRAEIHEHKHLITCVGVGKSEQ